MSEDPEPTAALPRHDRVLHPRAAVPLVAQARARLGNRIGAAGMLLAIVVTLRPGRARRLQPDRDRRWRSAAVVGAVGARRVKMTAMPQMVALFNGVGGGAAALVSLGEFHNLAPAAGQARARSRRSRSSLSALIGSISFAGSLVAFAKLQELISGRPIIYPGQQFVNALVIARRSRSRRAILAGRREQWLLVGADRGRARLRRALRAADRRRRHAGRDLAPERVHRARRGRGRVSARTTTC